MPEFRTTAPAALFALLIPLVLPAAEPETLDGQLAIVWVDAKSGVAPAIDTQYWLYRRGGSRVQLEVPDVLKGALLKLDRRPVRLRGQSRAAAAPGRTVFRVTEAQAAGGDAGAAAANWPQDAALGRKPWINLLCAFPDSAGEKRDTSYFAAMFTSTRPGLDYYWREQSNGQFSVSGSRAVGWYTLPQPYAAYVRDGNLDFELALNDCTALADNDVNFPDYTGINLVFNDSLGCCAWGGGGMVTRDGVERIYGVTWMPPWGWQNHTVFGHEMGHGLGLPHSRGNEQTYRNLWDVMSDLWYNCAAATDATLGCLGQHTIAYHKDKLGWIPASARYTLAPGATASVHLDKLERPAAGHQHMAVIPIHGSLSHFYTVEVRRRYSFDTRLPGAGVVIHEINTNLGEPANVVDGDGNGDPYDAGTRWVVGETFADKRGVRVTVDSSDGATGFNLTLASSDRPIFADGFEAGDVSRWSGGKLDDGDVAASEQAATAGSWGLRVLVDDNNQAHLTDHAPAAERNYLARFRIMPSGLTMAPGDRFTIFGAYTDTAFVVMIEMAYAPGGEYQVRAVARRDDGSQLYTPWTYIIGNYPHEMGVEWQAASAPGANDGTLRFTINDQSSADYTGLDNDTLRVERSLLGAVTGVDTGTRGTLLFDEFASGRW
jgi:M6 family metalloprotease-like protein